MTPSAADFSGHSVALSRAVTAATLTGLSLSPSLLKLPIGLTQQFTATAQFSDGTTQDVTALSAWSEKDMDGVGVAQLSSTGVATAKSLGQASITATYEMFSAQATLQVIAASLEGLSLEPTTPSLVIGSSLTFSAQGTFSDGSVQDVTAAADWAVADLLGSNVASIEDSTVTGESAGQATVSVSYQGLQADTTLIVTAGSLTALAINPQNPSVRLGMTQQFTATGTYSDGTTLDLTATVSWTATDVAPAMGVASITASGLATANSAGQSTISASYEGLSASTTLLATVMVSLQISPYQPAVLKGATQQLGAQGVYSDGSSQDLTTMVTWTATDIAPAVGVVSISASGLLTGNQLGQAALTITYNGMTASTICSVSSFITQTSGTTAELYGMWGSDANNVWAVGAGGTILKWDGASWISVSSGTTNDLAAVWGTQASNVWAVGAAGTILRWNGSAWSSHTSGTTNNLLGLWGSDANDVWAVGMNGTILKWNGISWSHLSGATINFSGMWGSDTNNVWIVGDAGQIRHRSGLLWVTQLSNTTSPLSAIWGSDISHIWAVGGFGEIVMWNGTGWNPQFSYTNSDLSGVWGLDSNSVWAAGLSGALFFWNGNIWAPLATGTTADLRAVWGSDANNIWTIGASGTILKWQS
jgi:hypothetical protein